MTNSDQQICTLYINLANIDAIADLLYQLDGTGDVSALNENTLQNTAATIQKLAQECKEAASELESICSKTKTSDKEVNDIEGKVATKKVVHHVVKSVLELDNINDRLADCITISELLWDSADTDPETSQRAGIMLYRNLEELEKSIDKVVK